MCLWTVKFSFCTTRVLCKAASLVATHLQGVWQTEDDYCKNRGVGVDGIFSKWHAHIYVRAIAISLLLLYCTILNYLRVAHSCFLVTLDGYSVQQKKENISNPMRLVTQNLFLCCQCRPEVTKFQLPWVKIHLVRSICESAVLCSNTMSLNLWQLSANVAHSLRLPLHFLLFLM